MYKELDIKNIKIFKNNQKLKIAPITLLFGENSSGKTTLLKTFDIIHNIFFEKYVKRGKNVGQKDNPFYRNENIQNISSKKIHYYSNQLNKKPIKIEIALDIPFNLNSEKFASLFQKIKIKKIFKGYDPVPMGTPEDNYWMKNKEESIIDVSRGEEYREMLSVPIKMELEIKYYSDSKISRVKNIIIKKFDGQEIIKLTREDKKYEKLENIWDKNIVGYVPPGLNRTIVRPRRFSSVYHRGRPIIEKDYFVDDALYADYKIKLKNNFVWNDCYDDYKKIFSDEKSTKLRLENYKLYSDAITKFKDLRNIESNYFLKNFKNNKKKVKFREIKIESEYFSYLIARYVFFDSEKNIEKKKTKIDQFLQKIYDKDWCEKAKAKVLRDSNEYKKLSFRKVPKKRTLAEVDKQIKERNESSFNIMAKYLFCEQIAFTNTNFLLVKNFINRSKPVSFSFFCRFAKMNTENLNYYRFFKNQKINIQHTIVDYNGKRSDPTMTTLQIISKFINGGLGEVFNQNPTFANNFKIPTFRDTLFNRGLLRNILEQIELNVNNYVICHPSKTDVPWGVPNKSDFPDDFDNVLDELEKKEPSEIKIFSNLEKDRRNNYLENFLDPKLISSDGSNFHRALISSQSKNHTINKKFLNKLNKVLKEILQLEIIIVTPEFLEKIWKNPERFAAFKLAQRYGYSYPTGSGRSSRTKYIMLRDCRFKKKFHIHGEEVGKGPTNILPFIGQILSEEPNLTYIIQELENNWHPKYQAKIIELIAKNMLNSNNKNFILETHSELFVLQLKKLVQKKILKPQDVSINFISRQNDGNSQITNIPLNDIGGFEKEWPGGFFTERMEILTS